MQTEDVSALSQHSELIDVIIRNECVVSSWFKKALITKNGHITDGAHTVAVHKCITCALCKWFTDGVEYIEKSHTDNHRKCVENGNVAASSLR